METYTNDGFCKKCGKSFIYIGDVPTGGFTKGTEPYCTCKEKKKEESVNYGWVCPICGQVYAPWVEKCPSHYNTTTSTTLTTIGSGEMSEIGNTTFFRIPVNYPVWEASYDSKKTCPVCGSSVDSGAYLCAECMGLCGGSLSVLDI